MLISKAPSATLTFLDDKPKITLPLINVSRFDDSITVGVPSQYMTLGTYQSFFYLLGQEVHKNNLQVPSLSQENSNRAFTTLFTTSSLNNAGDVAMRFSTEPSTVITRVTVDFPDHNTRLIIENYPPYNLKTLVAPPTIPKTDVPLPKGEDILAPRGLGAVFTEREWKFLKRFKRR